MLQDGSGVDSDASSERLGRELALARGGLRFQSPETEASYRAWHLTKAIPFTRVGMMASILAWLSVVGVNLATRLAGWERTTALALLVMMPVMLFNLVTTYQPRLLRWMVWTTAFANALAGVLALAVTNWSYPEAASAGVAIVAYFGFTIFRLRPFQAALAVLSYVALHQYLLVERASSSEWATAAAIFHSAIGWIAFSTGLLACIVLEWVSRNAYQQERIIAAQKQAIEHERARADALLVSILPAPIADRLKQAPQTIADRYEQATVLFADVVGFTPLAARVSPEKVVDMLNELFTRFDELAHRHGVEKIKTIGDAYMAVAGVPEPRDDHAEAVAGLALAMRVAIEEIAVRHAHDIRLRIGICSGPVIAGVIGTRKPAYDLWGDTVNTAARMESHGIAGQIQVAESTYRRLNDKFRFQERGVLEIKGKGPMRAWLLEGTSVAAVGT